MVYRMSCCHANSGSATQIQAERRPRAATAEAQGQAARQEVLLLLREGSGPRCVSEVVSAHTFQESELSEDGGAFLSLEQDGVDLWNRQRKFEDWKWLYSVCIERP
jgi:hypothetical protein